MTKDDITRMAREAGLRDCTCAGKNGCLERFAALVADAEAKRIYDEGMVTVGHMREQIAKEREACAALCDQATEGNLRTLDSCNDGKEFGAALVSAGAKEQSERLAFAIRARNT